LIAHCEETDKKNTKVRTKNQNITILIGPEGDFSEKIILALEHNYIPVSLGHTRLRTETAPSTTHSVAFLMKND
jgi:16S rRNA (uracil1498-N3)-methyltransferase